MSPYPADTRWTLALNSALVAETAYDGSDGYFPIQGDRVAAYDLHQGTRRWMVSARPVSSPAVGGGLLFLEQTGGLSALHVKDGSVAWTAPLTEKLAVPLVWGNGRLVAATPTAILSFRGEDGTLQWRHELSGKPHRAPSLGGDGVYVPMADRRVLALRADNGEMLWERRLPDVPNDILVSDPQLFVGSNDNYLYCLNVRDGLTRWRSARTGADVVSRPTVDDDHVYFVSLDNVLRAVNRSNGVQQWKKGLTFRPAWTAGFEGSPYARPIIAADTVMVTGIQGPLLAFYRKDGAAAGELVTGADLIAAPPYTFESAQAFGPVVVVVTRNLKAGTTVKAVSHRIEPPEVPLTVLALVPAPLGRPAPLAERPPGEVAPRTTPPEDVPPAPAPIRP